MSKLPSIKNLLVLIDGNIHSSNMLLLMYYLMTLMVIAKDTILYFLKSQIIKNQVIHQAQKGVRTKSLLEHNLLVCHAGVCYTCFIKNSSLS